MTTDRQPPHHNTITCYTDYRCRLPECVERYREWDRARYRAKANGEPGKFIDAAPVRQHLHELYAADVTIHAIARTTGLTYLAIRSFTHHEYGNRRPRRRRCTPETAAKILAVTPANLAPGRINATGTVRRLQALVAMGWPMERVALQAGLSADNIVQLTRRKQVLGGTARRIAEAYELMRHRKPAKHGVDKRNISRARRRAAANRWPDPTYWATRMDVIDDPHFQPLYGVTRREIVAQDAGEVMRFAGLDRQAAADRLGVSRAYIDHAFREYPQYAIGVAA